MFSKLDISMLPFPDNEKMGASIALNFELQEEFDPFADGISANALKSYEDHCERLFRLFLDHERVISRVTFLGISDRDSWRNDWPMKGRTDYPLLFDRNFEPKPIVERLLELAKRSE